MAAPVGSVTTPVTVAVLVWLYRARETTTNTDKVLTNNCRFLDIIISPDFHLETIAVAGNGPERL
jgi:hypothetical protein